MAIFPHSPRNTQENKVLFYLESEVSRMTSYFNANNKIASLLISLIYHNQILGSCQSKEWQGLSNCILLNIHNR